MADDDWDWQSCGSGDESGGEVTGRGRRIRRSTAQVMVRVERAVTAVESASEAIQAAEDESKRWRVIAIVVMAVQFLQALPGGVKTGFTTMLTKHGLRAVILAVLTHLLTTTVRKLMQSRKVKITQPVAQAAPLTTTTTTQLLPVVAANPTVDDTDVDLARLPEGVVKVLDLANNPGWIKIYEGSAKWEAMDVEWNGGHKVTKFTAEVVKCSVNFFVKRFIEESPKAQRSFDDLLENYDVVEDGGSLKGRIIYMSFHTPVWGITQRDICAHIVRCQLTPDEAKQHKVTPHGAPLKETQRHDYENVRNTVVLGTVSATHENAPEKSGYVRSHMNTQGYIITPLSDGTCKLVEVVALDVKGALPTWAVTVGAKRVYERFSKMVKYLESEYQKEQ